MKNIAHAKSGTGVWPRDAKGPTDGQHKVRPKAAGHLNAPVRAIPQWRDGSQARAPEARLPTRRVGGTLQSAIKPDWQALRGQCRSIDKLAATSSIRTCLLYTSDAADDLLCVDLGGRRIIKKKKR